MASNVSCPKQELKNVPGVCASPDSLTKDFIFQQTMYRIKDAKQSLDFYTRILGMNLLAKFDFPNAKFSLYFLGYEPFEEIPDKKDDQLIWLFRKKGCLELTHNWGTESDPDFSGYHNGNTEPRGYGHIGISVSDVESACERFEKLGVEFSKRPGEGKMKGIAFIKDPDGYLIEILSGPSMCAII